MCYNRVKGKKKFVLWPTLCLYKVYLHSKDYAQSLHDPTRWNYLVKELSVGKQGQNIYFIRINYSELANEQRTKLHWSMKCIPDELSIPRQMHQFQASSRSFLSTPVHKVKPFPSKHMDNTQSRRVPWTNVKCSCLHRHHS